MPKLWNDILVVTEEELVPRFFNTYNTLKSELYRYKDLPYGITRAQKGGNGRKLLIKYHSLTREVQEALGDPTKNAHILERYYQIDTRAVEFYGDWKYANNDYLRTEAQERYITNASVLNAAIQLRNARETERLNKGGTLRGIMPTICTDVQSFNDILRAKYGISHNLPATLRHFKALYKNYTAEGYVGIIKDRNHKRKSNALKLTGDVTALLNNLFGSLSYKPNPTEVATDYAAFLKGDIDVINKDTGEVYNPATFPPLGESTVRKYLTSWDSMMATHPKRNGDRQKLLSKFDPHHSFNMPTMAGSLISVDDRQPPFEYQKGKRMWFYNGIDLASEAFTVWVYGKTKEGIILEFYRQMVRNYHDWGFNLPYEIEAESSLNSSFRESFLKDGRMFDRVNIYANKARSKRIEAFYKPLRYQLEKQREGWLARPFALSESNQLSPAKKVTIPYDILTEESLVDIMTWNNMPHSKHPDKSRWEVFCETQNPDLKPTNYKAILPGLGHKTTSSCNAGIVRFRNREWLLGDRNEIFTGESLINLMKKVEGNDIDIFWLDGNDGRVIKALMYINGDYKGQVLPKPRYQKAHIERTQEDEQARNLMARYAATVQNYMRIRKNEIEPVTVIDNRKKTINDKFKIPGIKTYKQRINPVQIEEDIEDDYDFTPGKAVGHSWDNKFKID